LTEEAPEGRTHDAIEAESRDAYRPEPPRGGMGLKDDLLMALRFFSRLPTGDSPHERPDLGRMTMALPMATVVMGIGPVLILGSVWLGLPGYFAAALAVGGMVVVGAGMM